MTMTDSAVRHSVYCLIDGERDYQDKLWGGAPHDASKSVGDFIIYMDRFLNKAKELYTTRDSNKPALEEIRKITALGVTCMEYNVTPKRMEYNVTPKRMEYNVTPKRKED